MSQKHAEGRELSLVGYTVNVFVSWTQIGVTWERGPSVEELPPSYWPADLSVVHFLD